MPERSGTKRPTVRIGDAMIRRAKVAKLHTENPLLSYRDLAKAAGAAVATVSQDVKEIQAGYEVVHPGAINEMRERHTEELETLIRKMTRNVDRLLADPGADQMAVAQQVGVVIKGYERLHKMHAVDAPKQVSLNARLLQISIERGIPLDRLLRTARHAVALLEGG